MNFSGCLGLSAIESIVRHADLNAAKSEIKEKKKQEDVLEKMMKMRKVSVARLIIEVRTNSLDKNVFARAQLAYKRMQEKEHAATVKTELQDRRNAKIQTKVVQTKETFTPR